MLNHPLCHTLSSSSSSGLISHWIIIFVILSQLPCWQCPHAPAVLVYAFCRYTYGYCSLPNIIIIIILTQCSAKTYRRCDHLPERSILRQLQGLGRCDIHVTADLVNPGGRWPLVDHRHVPIPAMAACRLSPWCRSFRTVAVNHLNQGLIKFVPFYLPYPLKMAPSSSSSHQTSHSLQHAKIGQNCNMGKCPIFCFFVSVFQCFHFTCLMCVFHISLKYCCCCCSIAWC